MCAVDAMPVVGVKDKFDGWLRLADLRRDQRRCKPELQIRMECELEIICIIAVMRILYYKLANN